MEELLVFQVTASPDAPLARLEATLRREGFRTRPGRLYDVAARRRLDRVFIGIGPHPTGLAARVKVKSLVPGRTGPLHEHVAALVTSELGVPFERTELPGGPRR